MKNIELLFKACKQSNIVLNRKKIQIGQENLSFAGYLVGKDGARPDPKRLQAIKDFPCPTGISELRGFMGLCNTLTSYRPDFAHITEPLRQLLSKNVAFVMGPKQLQAFEKAKEIMTSDVVVKYFDKNLPTELYTDASRINGLVFCLCQRNN